MNRRALAGLVPPPDGFAQLRKAEGVRVVGLAAMDRLGACGQDLGGRVEVRLADLEVNDGPPGVLQLLGALHDVHHQERFDLDGARRETHSSSSSTRARLQPNRSVPVHPREQG